MAKQEETSKSAKIRYRPIGLTSSILGGLLAGIIFKQVWRRATPGDQSDPPTALESEYDLKEILVAATIQGAIYSLVKKWLPLACAWAAAAPKRGNAWAATNHRWMVVHRDGALRLIEKDGASIAK